MWVWGEKNRRIRSWARALARNTLGVEGRAQAPGCRLGRMTSNQSLTWTCTNQTKSWLVHSWTTFGVRTSHHLPPYNILCAWPHGHHPNGILFQDSQMGVLKFPKLGLSQLWGPITLCANLRSKWGLEQSCSRCCELSNSLLHFTYTQVNRGDSWLLVVGS
jgi:hypothetical protein